MEGGAPPIGRRLQHTGPFSFHRAGACSSCFSWNLKAGAGTRRRRLVVRRAAALMGLTPLLTCPPAAAAWRSTRQPRARKGEEQPEAEQLDIASGAALGSPFGGTFSVRFVVGEGWHSLSLATCIARACVHEFGICLVRVRS